MSFNAASQVMTSPKKTTQKRIVPDESKIVNFPIRASKTTDVNYERNIQKSKATQANLDREPNVVLKNDNFYIDKIKKLKRRIQEIRENPNSPNVNIEKLGGLVSKLAAMEEEYIEFKKSK